MKRATIHTVVVLLIGFVASARPGLAQTESAAAADPAIAPAAPAQPAAAMPVAPAPSVGIPPAPPSEPLQVQSGPHGRGMLIAGILTAAVGSLAGVGAGITFALKANSLDNDASHTLDQSTKDKAKTYRNMEYACFGLVAASQVVGTTLIIWGIVRLTSGPSDSPPPVAVVPMLGPGLGGAAISGSF
jgi:hypothetical protein